MDVALFVDHSAGFLLVEKEVFEYQEGVFRVEVVFHFVCELLDQEPLVVVVDDGFREQRLQVIHEEAHVAPLPVDSIGTVVTGRDYHQLCQVLHTELDRPHDILQVLLVQETHIERPLLLLLFHCHHRLLLFPSLSLLLLLLLLPQCLLPRLLLLPLLFLLPHNAFLVLHFDLLRVLALNQPEVHSQQDSPAIQVHVHQRLGAKQSAEIRVVGSFVLLHQTQRLAVLCTGIEVLQQFSKAFGALGVQLLVVLLNG